MLLENLEWPLILGTLFFVVIAGLYGVDNLKEVKEDLSRIIHYYQWASAEELRVYVINRDSEQHAVFPLVKKSLVLNSFYIEIKVKNKKERRCYPGWHQIQWIELWDKISHNATAILGLVGMINVVGDWGSKVLSSWLVILLLKISFIWVLLISVILALKIMMWLRIQAVNWKYSELVQMQTEDEARDLRDLLKEGEGGIPCVTSRARQRM